MWKGVQLWPGWHVGTSGWTGDSFVLGDGAGGVEGKVPNVRLIWRVPQDYRT